MMIVLPFAASLVAGCRTRLWELPDPVAICDDGVSPWPMFAHDPQHRSRSCQPGPRAPNLKWRSSVYTTGLSSLVVAADGTIYAATRGPSGSSVVAFSPESGLERRRWPISTGADLPSLALGLDGTLYVSGQYPTDEQPDGVLALDPDGGGQRWKFPCDDEGEPLTVAGDGTLYVTCGPGPPNNDEGAYALRPDGHVKWRQAPFRVGAIGLDGAAFGLFDMFNLPKTISSIESSAGRENWSITVMLESRFGLIGERGSFDLVVGAGTEAFLDSHDQADGHLLWHSPLDEEPASTAALGIGGEYYIADGKHILAKNAGGAFMWAYAPEVSDDQFQIPVVAGDGTLYVLGWRKAVRAKLIVFAFDEHGVLKWSTELDHEESQLPQSLALGRGGILYAAGTSRLYAIGP